MRHIGVYLQNQLATGKDSNIAISGRNNDCNSVGNGVGGGIIMRQDQEAIRAFYRRK